MITFDTYGLKHKYPHMMPADVTIWERFIVDHPEAFDGVTYDVPVGEGAAFDTVVNYETGGNVSKLYQRKIDVVAVKGDVLYVIEVKPRASTSALGQVKGYVTLFKRDYTPTQRVQGMVLTDQLLPEMDFLAKEEGVQIVLA